MFDGGKSKCDNSEAEQAQKKRSASCVCVLKDCVLECDAERGGGSLKRVGVTPWQDCAAVCTSQSYDRGQE